MTPCLPFAAALPRVHGGILAWGILSGACWARRDDPRSVGQQRLAERPQRRIQIRHREGRRRIVLLICQSRPITVKSRKKGIGPQRDPSCLLVHEICQWRRRCEANPWSTRGSPGCGARWGHRGCTRLHIASGRVQLGEVGRRRHRSGRAVIDDRPTRRSTSSSLNKPTSDRGTGYPMRAWQRPQSPANPPEIVAVLGTTTLVRRPAEVTSLSARSVEGTPLEIDPQPSLPPTGGDDHGKAQGGIVVQSTVGFIKRRWGRPPHCQ